MNNDLISRSALKETFEKTVCIEPMPYAFVKQIIDNAPAVEPETKLVANVTFNKEQMEELVEKAKADILAQIERPQGEWITHRTGYLIWEECNQCHAQVGTVGMNFCPNCGAEMRGKDNGSI